MMVWNTSKAGDIVVSVRDRETLLADLETRLNASQGFSIATINLDHVVKLQSDAAFRAAYSQQTHVTADGKPIVWLSCLAGQDVSLVPGSELIEPVASLAAKTRTPVGLMGATEASLSAAAEALLRNHPGLEVAMIHAPAMGFDPDGEDAAAVIEKIRVSGARVIFVALGAPKQELFAVRARSALPEVGFLSIGAGLDFVSGAQTRAPKWVRALAGEWLWRLALNPRRLVGRYWACILALPGLTVRAIGARFS